jgi:hypothetical protein
MFVIVDLQTIFLTQYVGIFKNYFHTKFHTSDSSCLLIIAMKPKAKADFHFVSLCYLTFCKYVSLGNVAFSPRSNPMHQLRTLK